MRQLLFVCVPALCTIVASAAEPSKPRSFDAAVLPPFWLSTTMEGESVLFIKESADGRPRASLLFEPTEIRSVCSSSGKVTYDEGTDYTWRPGSKEIVLPRGSRIVSKTPGDLRRPAGSQRHALTHRDGNGEILFGATHEYHEMQTMVTYTHEADAWAGPKPSFAGDRLVLQRYVHSMISHNPQHDNTLRSRLCLHQRLVGGLARRCSGNTVSLEPDNVGQARRLTENPANIALSY